MAMRTIEKKDLDLSRIPDDRINAINRSIAKGKKPSGKISPLVGARKVRVQTQHRKSK